MTISIIVAMSLNRVIGRDNRLPWKLPADLRRFKRLTMGHCLIMGRKTYESIGRPLPGRTVIVLTRQPDYAPPGVLVAHTLDEALALASGDEIFVAGGAEIYRQTLPLADRLYLTLIEREIAGDAYFPPLNEADWQLISQEHYDADEANPYPHRFFVYERKRENSTKPLRSPRPV
jgi:dihydrofolate reductase